MSAWAPRLGELLSAPLPSAVLTDFTKPTTSGPAVVAIAAATPSPSPLPDTSATAASEAAEVVTLAVRLAALCVHVLMHVTELAIVIAAAHPPPLPPPSPAVTSSLAPTSALPTVGGLGAREEVGLAAGSTEPEENATSAIQKTVMGCTDCLAMLLCLALPLPQATPAAPGSAPVPPPSLEDDRGVSREVDSATAESGTLREGGIEELPTMRPRRPRIVELANGSGTLPNTKRSAHRDTRFVDVMLDSVLTKPFLGVGDVATEDIAGGGLGGCGGGRRGDITLLTAVLPRAAQLCASTFGAGPLVHVTLGGGGEREREPLFCLGKPGLPLLRLPLIVSF